MHVCQSTCACARGMVTRCARLTERHGDGCARLTERHGEGCARLTESVLARLRRGAAASNRKIEDGVRIWPELAELSSGRSAAVKDKQRKRCCCHCSCCCRVVAVAVRVAPAANTNAAAVYFPLPSVSCSWQYLVAPCTGRQPLVYDRWTDSCVECEL